MFKARYRTIATAEDIEPGTVIVLLGTALKGPAMEPVQINGTEHARRVFGDEGALPRGYKLAYAVNPKASYFLMRVNGEHARLAVPFAPNKEAFVLKAIDAGEAGNRIGVTIDDHNLTITDGEITNYYSLHELASVGALVDKINSDANRGFSPVEAITASPSLPLTAVVQAFAASNVLFLAGGEDGYPLTKNELYLLLEEAYTQLEGYRTDIVVPLEAYLNDNVASYEYGSLSAIYGGASYSAGDVLDLEVNYGGANFPASLMDFCSRQMGYGLMAHGVIGVRPMPEPNKLMPWKNRFIHDLARASCLGSREGFVVDGVDRSHHVSAVLGDILQGEYVSAAPAYAALLADSGTETTTGRGLPGFTEQKVNLDGDSLRLAAQYGLVTLRPSLTRNHLAVYSGVTLAEAGRPLHYIANVRTAQYVIYRLRRALDPFVGAVTGTIVIRDVLEQTADNILRELEKEGVISGYSLETAIELMDIRSLRCRFHLSFRPKYSIEDVSVVARFTL